MSYDLSACACCGHTSACNGSDPVPGLIHITFTFNGHSLTLPMSWIENSSACSGAEGWEYTGGNAEICTGMVVGGAGVALCCSGSTWVLSMGFYLDGAGPTSFTTDGGGFAAITVVTSNPIDWTTNSIGHMPPVACGDAEMFVEITP